MTDIFFPCLLRDLRLLLARGSETWSCIFFFLAVVSLFPFVLGAVPEILRLAAPGILWTAALLAALLTVESLWQRDYEDGTLDLLVMSTARPFHLVLSRVAAHWVLTGLPLLGACVIAAFLLGLPGEILAVVFLSLAFGTLYMSLAGTFGALLTLGARRPGLLTVLIVLPLFLPMLVLGVLAGAAALAGAGVLPYLLLQLALLLAALPLALAAGGRILLAALRC